MSSTAAALLVWGPLVGLGLPIVWWIFHSGSSGRDLAQEAEFRRRLANPDFPALERCFGETFSPSLRRLYQDQTLIERQGLLITLSDPDGTRREHSIAWFQPADEQAIRQLEPQGTLLFAFANNGAGDEFVVDPRLADPPVLYHLHETGKQTTLAATLSEFLAAPRRDQPDE